jgi:ligand of Numb protein X 3/4
MYTSPEHLAETIALQQRMLRHAMVEQANMLSTLPEEPSNEWKVKRRSDGTRYITKKQNRHRVLKEREEQLIRERHGTTTDDDAGSELKTGRFWSRDQRRQHLEKAKLRKLREHQLAVDRCPTASDQV